MKSVLFVTAIMFAGAAAAQTYPTDTSRSSTQQTKIQPDHSVHQTIPTPVRSTTTTPVMTTTTTEVAMSNADIPNPGETVAPSNADPELDARGIAVISDPAVVPAGFNLEAGLGGPLETTTPAMQPADASYPACSRTVTDNCVQTYERGRSPN